MSEGVRQRKGRKSKQKKEENCGEKKKEKKKGSESMNQMEHQRLIEREEDENSQSKET
jgi:hypothetical protein